MILSVPSSLIDNAPAFGQLGGSETLTLSMYTILLLVVIYIFLASNAAPSSVLKYAITSVHSLTSGITTSATGATVPISLGSVMTPITRRALSVSENTCILNIYDDKLSTSSVGVIRDTLASVLISHE